MLCAGVALLVAGVAARAVDSSGAADLESVGNTLLVVSLVVIGLAYLVPIVRGWLARPRPAGPSAVEDTVGRLVRRAAPGVVVAVVDGAGVTYDARGRAGPGIAELDETTVFEIGSLTKTFTALLLAEMVERGDVALEDPLSRFVSLDPVGPPITLLDLATHTAGLPRLPPLPSMTARAVLAHPDPYRTITDADLERALRRSRSQPGAPFAYSNFGFALLGLALSRVAGKPWADLVTERVITPLGLDETSVVVPPDRRARTARGHDRFGVPARAWDLGAVAPAGALHSTARDMGKYVQALLSPSGSLAAALASVQQPRRRRDERDQVALSWLLRASGGRTITWHNGGTGGFGSFVGFDADAGRGVVVLTNAEHSAAVDNAGFAFLGREAEESGLRQRV
jgi:CubicO group peptidase (beta-lactamase class C family)